MSDGRDIGALLRRERESRGWTVRDVTHRTRIPGPTVEALEANDYTRFPSAAYAKSFLAQYCDYLELEADEWLDDFDTGNAFANLGEYEYLREHDEFLGEEIIPVQTKAPRKPSRTSRKPRKASTPAPAPQRTESASALQPLVVFLITASLLTAAAFGYRHLSGAIAEARDEPAPTVEAPGFVEAPNIVHSRPAPTKPLTGEAAKPPVVAATIVGEDGVPPISRALPVPPDGAPVTFDAPPPRAVIIEE